MQAHSPPCFPRCAGGLTVSNLQRQGREALPIVIQTGIPLDGVSLFAASVSVLCCLLWSGKISCKLVPAATVLKDSRAELRVKPTSASHQQPVSSSPGKISLTRALEAVLTASTASWVISPTRASKSLREASEAATAASRSSSSRSRSSKARSRYARPPPSGWRLSLLRSHQPPTANFNTLFLELLEILCLQA
jgi:hypothetical protein